MHVKKHSEQNEAAGQQNESQLAAEQDVHRNLFNSNKYASERLCAIIFNALK
jgi:hypothetical protein